MGGLSLALSHGLSGQGGMLAPVPGTAYDFAAGDAAPTVARAAAATYFNASGVLSIAAANTARIAHDPLGGERLGLLIEDKDGSQRIRYSNDLSQSNWSKSATTVSTDTSEVADPVGGHAADILLETATSANHNLSQTTSFTTLAIDTWHVAYAILKARDRTRIKMIAGGFQAVFDLTTGEVDAQFNTGTLSQNVPRACRFGNGWVLCAMEVLIPAGTSSHTLTIRPIDAATGQTTSYLGDITKGIYFYHAQFRPGRVLDMPIFSVFPQLTRDQDVATKAVSSWWRQSGTTLLFEARAPHCDGAFVVAQIDDGSEINRVRLWRDAFGNGRLLVTAAGVEQANLDLGGWQNDTDRAVCFAIVPGTVRCSVNGQPALTATVATPPSGLTTLRYGLDSSGVGPSTIIRRTAAWASRLGDGVLRQRSLKRVNGQLWCIGDSFTSGGVSGQTPGYTYAAQLARLLNRGYFNVGVGGETSAQIRTRFLADNDHLNWLTIIEAGRNDGSGAGAAITANIADMVANLPANARYLVISIPYATSDSGPTQAAIAAINSGLSGIYGNRFVAVDWSTVARVADNLHPTDAGNTTLAVAVKAQIEALGW